MATEPTYSGNIYDAAAAGTTDFALTTSDGDPIPYLEPSHIHVYKSTDEGVTWVALTRPDDWDFISNGTAVRLTTGIAAGEYIKVQRLTPVDSPYVTFQEGSLLTAQQLNDLEEFLMYVEQEIADGVVIIQGDAADALAAAQAAQATADAALPKAGGTMTGDIVFADTQTFPGGGISDAPNDGTLYGRKSEAWAVVPAGMADAPSDGNTYGRKDAAWARVDSGGGGGITYKGTRDLTLAAPGSPEEGDFYVNTATSGTVDNSWTGIGGTTLTGAERVAYDGSEWEMLPMPPASTPNLQSVCDVGNTTTTALNSGSLTAYLVSTTAADNVADWKSDVGTANSSKATLKANGDFATVGAIKAASFDLASLPDLP